VFISPAAIRRQFSNQQTFYAQRSSSSNSRSISNMINSHAISRTTSSPSGPLFFFVQNLESCCQRTALENNAGR
jgi:hypothetical protein